MSTMSISCVARAVELRVAKVEHDVDADHRYVSDVEPGGIGEGVTLLPGPDFAVKAEAVTDDYENFKHDALALRGAGADGF